MNNTGDLLGHVRLRFNIDNPSVEECYSYGYECAKAEISEDDNPFAVGTSEHDHWSDGWWAGFYGEEPLFDITEADEEETNLEPANDRNFEATYNKWVLRAIEMGGVLAASAVVGYQLLDMVA